MKKVLINFVMIWSVLLLFACEKKTDQPDNDNKWSMNIENQTDFNVKGVFKENTQYSDSISFDIPKQETTLLFNGASGFLSVDPITKQTYDSASVIFSDNKSIAFNLDDTSVYNILRKENYVKINDSEYIFYIDSIFYSIAN